MRVLVTGADGFVGRALCPVLRQHGMQVRRATRSPLSGDRAGADEQVAIGDIGAATDWSRALDAVDVVIHLAARVHVMNDTAVDPLAAFQAVNVAGTENLALQSAGAGVRRFIYLSSIKVSGETTAETAFRGDERAPEGPYAVSKQQAEAALQRVAADTGLEWVIVRPPLVYGPGVKGNFLRLLRFSGRRIPLPLGAVSNRRSLLYVDNLADFLAACVSNGQACGQTFVVSDDEDLSTTELLRRIAVEFGHAPRLVPVPAVVLRGLAALLGQRAAADRLLGSLQIDIGKARDRLGWRPPVSVADGLRRTVAWYRQSSGS